jgi:hypothetical protein
MDKLKQVLKYKFWILLGIAALLPLIGWFLASSGMARSHTERKSRLDSTFAALIASDQDPNSDWESNLKAVNVRQEAEISAAWRALYSRQQELKFWPPKLSTNDPALFTNRDRERYKEEYEKQRELVLGLINPGLVLISPDLMPAPEVDWEYAAPSQAAIEAAQEDLWLLAGLFRAIAQVNKDASSPFDAPVRQVLELRLRSGDKGGTGAKTPAASPTGGTGTGQASSMGTQMADMAKGQMKQMFGSGRAGPGNLSAPGGSAGGAAGGQSGPEPGTIPDPSFNPDDELGAEQPESRYVEVRNEWKSRGLYMELVVEQERVPDLLVALSNAEWPVRIARVQQADIKEEDLMSPDAVGSRPAGGLTAGAGGLTAGAGASAAGGAAALSGAGLAGAGLGGGRGASGGIDAAKAMSGQMAAMGGRRGGGGGGALMGATGAMTGIGGAGKRATGATGRSAGAEISADRQRALDNANLVRVAIDGWLTIYQRPKDPSQPVAGALPAGTGPVSANPGAAPAAASAAPASGTAQAPTVPAGQGTSPAAGLNAESSQPAAAAAAGKGQEPATNGPADAAPAEAPAGSRKPDESTPPDGETSVAAPAPGEAAPSSGKPEQAPQK